MAMISLILQSLGLQPSEVKTYIAAHENGPSTVLELTKHTGLSRQATYVAIESLSKRGLMSSILRGKKRLYASEHPDRLLAYAHRRESEMHDRILDLERIIPELALQAGGEKPVVRLFEGKEGIRAMFEDLQGKDADTIDEITDLDAMWAVLEREDLAPIRDVSRKNKIRGFYTKVDVASEDGHVRRFLLPAELTGFKSNITLCNDKIYFVTFEGKMYSIFIESRELAAALRALFELAAKRYEKK